MRVFALLMVAITACAVEPLTSESSDLTSNHVTLYGCNADALVQLPGDVHHFVGRLLANGDPKSCAGTNWNLTLLEMDWSTQTLSLVRQIFTTPQKISNGYTITSAYDPSIVSFGGEMWVSFECGGAGIETAGACVGPLTPGGTIDPTRTVLAVNGGSYEPSDPYNHSASHPFLFVWQGELYMYWTAVQILKTDFNDWKSLTGRGAQVIEESGGARRLFVAGADHTIESDSPLTIEVLGLGDDPNDNTTADFFQVIALDNGEIYVTAGLGGSGCTAPKSGEPGCYRLAIFKPTSALELDAFNASQFKGLLPHNPNEYTRIVIRPDQSIELMGMIFQDPFPNQTTLSPGFQTIALPDSPYFPQD